MIKRLLVTLLLIGSAWAATPVTVTGTLQVGSSSGLKGNAFVRFRLRNFSGFVPRVTGTAIIVQTQFDVRPTDTNGNFSTTVYANSDIIPNTCGAGGTDACTWWTVEYWNDGKVSSSGNYCVPTGAPYNLNTATPCQTPPLPPAPVVIGGGSGLGVIFPLAGATAPSPVGTNTCVGNVSGWTQNAAGVYQTQFSVDPNFATTAHGGGSPGFLDVCRPIIFNGTGVTPGFGMNGTAFDVYDTFSPATSPTSAMSQQMRYENSASDTGTLTASNLNRLYAELFLKGTPTISSTFVANERVTIDDFKTGGSKPRVWTAYQAAVRKNAAYDITNCATGIDGFPNGPCYAGFYGEVGTTNGTGTEDETGAVFDVFAGGVANGLAVTNQTGNVFHALVQTTSNRPTFNRGFASEDFGTSATAYDFLANGVNASGTPSGYSAFVGPTSFGSTTHPGAGIQVAITGGALQLESTSGTGNLTGPSSGIKYNMGSSLYWQLDGNGLSWNSGIAAGPPTNVVLANIFAPPSSNNAGGIILKGAPATGSACAGNAELRGGDTNSSSNNPRVSADGACSNGFGAIGGNINIVAGSTANNNPGGTINLIPGTGIAGNGFVVIGNGSIQGQFILESGNGSSRWVELLAPSSMTTNWNFTFPTTAGSANQALLTNGSGVTSWTTIPLLYNHSGTQQTVAHIIRDRCTLGTDCAITLTGSAVFTSSSTYDCTVADRTGANAVQFNPTSGSAFTLTGTGTDTLSYVCVGN